jgi:hypothetical protein
MKKYIYFIILLFIIIIFTFISCELLGVSISGRVSEFVSDLNKSSNRNLHENFHSDMPPSLYNDETLFNTTELRIAYQTFSISLIGNAVDVAGGEKYQTGNLTSSSPGQPFVIEFNFKEEDPGVWYIIAMSVGGFTCGTLTTP